MNIAKAAFCRVYQTAFRMALPILPYREPEHLSSVEEIPALLQSKGIRTVLLVTDRGLHSGGATASLEENLTASGIRCVVYDETAANPTVDNVGAARELYGREGCEGLIAFGGGSPMDCAKAVGALVAQPRCSLQQLKGLLKVYRRLPTLIAVPTTAGTGSEGTLTAVITDSATRHKYTINSFPLIPHYAVLDPTVTFSLPAHLTATTGMDALTHAVEAYIGRSTTKQTRQLALEAVERIFADLETAYQNGDDEQARRGMLEASYKAGIAFSKSYVGYVHAIAHSLGGQYNIPHGLANAVLLPVVLREYGACIHRKLYTLAVTAGVADAVEPEAIAAEKFIGAIEAMNRRMGIPTSFSQLRPEDIPLMAAHADKEANPLYPVPRLLDTEELECVYIRVMGGVST